MKDCGYEVFPINPNADKVEGVRCYANVAAIPGDLDGVVIATHPAVAAKLATKQIQLHGWVYNIEKGSILCYEPTAEAFIEMEQAYAEQMLALSK